MTAAQAAHVGTVVEHALAGLIADLGRVPTAAEQRILVRTVVLHFTPAAAMPSRAIH